MNKKLPRGSKKPSARVLNMPEPAVKRVSIARQNELIRKTAVMNHEPMSENARKIGSSIGNNPKTGAGALKAPLHLVPTSAEFFLSLAFADGVKPGKYWPFNWRDQPVPVTTYYAAAKRHLDAYFDGEEIDPDSDVPHLAHAMACMAILLDAGACNTLINDRPKPGATAQLMRDYHQRMLAKAAKV